MIVNLPKRHFYNEKEYTLDYENKILILKPEFHKKLIEKSLWNKFGFKKIGGSSVGDVLEADQYKSQFLAFCRMSWLDMPVLDKKYINAGIAIEPKVIKAIEQMNNFNVQTFNPHDYEFDYFKDKDSIIGGIPDGFVPEKKLILEIKTTSIKNLNKWNNFGVPIGYLQQAQIYAYLMGVKNYAIVATYLEESDYKDPQNYPIEQRKIKSFKYEVNLDQVMDNVNKIKSWYLEHTSSGISPKWNDKKDKDLLEYLECKTEDEYIKLLEKWKLEGKFIDEE